MFLDLGVHYYFEHLHDYYQVSENGLYNMKTLYFQSVKNKNGYIIIGQPSLYISFACHLIMI